MCMWTQLQETHIGFTWRFSPCALFWHPNLGEPGAFLILPISSHKVRYLVSPPLTTGFPIFGGPFWGLGCTDQQFLLDSPLYAKLDCMYRYGDKRMQWWLRIIELIKQLFIKHWGNHQQVLASSLQRIRLLNASLSLYWKHRCSLPGKWKYPLSWYAINIPQLLLSLSVWVALIFI